MLYAHRALVIIITTINCDAILATSGFEREIQLEDKLGQSQQRVSIRDEARQYIAEHAAELAAIAAAHKLDFLKLLLDVVTHEADPRAIDTELLREMAAKMRKRG